jgi:hypothetical protein|tara:strand:+ start:195 stop:521 length:327 start_codon:yes stop_codon:yes gene_type:complete
MKRLLIFIGILFSVWLTTVSISNVAYSKQGDEKIFAGWILHMFISGQLKEYTPRGGMSQCLKIKRKIMRSQGADGARWECKKGKLKLRHYDGGVDGMKWLPVEHLGKE